MVAKKVVRRKIDENEKRRVLQRIHAEGWSAWEGAKQLGYASSAVKRWQHEYGPDGSGRPKSKSPRPRKQYSRDEKRKAVDLAERTTFAEASRQLDIAPGTIYNWRTELQGDASEDDDPTPEQFARDYDGPSGKVEAVRNQYGLSIEAAAITVQRANGGAQLDLPNTSSDADDPHAPFIAEIERLRRENHALRILVHQYLPEA